MGRSLKVLTKHHKIKEFKNTYEIHKNIIKKRNKNQKVLDIQLENKI